MRRWEERLGEDTLPYRERGCYAMLEGFERWIGWDVGEIRSREIGLCG